MQIDAFFLRASSANLFPSIFFPLIPKKILFFFISFELIDALLIKKLLLIFIFKYSLMIFTFKFLDNFLFFL